MVRAQIGAVAEWSVAEHLLANISDSLTVANWQRSAKKGDRQPKLLSRPGSQPEKKVGGGQSFSIEELQQIMARRRTTEEVT